MTLDDKILRFGPYTKPSLRVPYKQQRVDTDKLSSIVVLSMERKEDLEQCVRTMYQTTSHLPFELIIWDNGSGTKTDCGTPVTDPREIERNKTIQYLQSIDGKTLPGGNGKIKVVFNGKNDGCSTGRRKALDLVDTNAEYVVTMDNDMEFTPGWLDGLLAKLDRDPTVGALTSKTVYSNGQVQFNGINFALEEGHFFRPIYLDQGKRASDTTADEDAYTDLVSGGATIIRKSVADQIEHSDDYPNGFEDFDYSLQISELGWRVANCPDSVIIHHHFSRRKAEDKKKDGAYARDRQDIKRKFTSQLAFLERTGFNYVRSLNWLDQFDGTGRKIWLDAMGYTDLFPGRKGSSLTYEETSRQFDSILRERRARGETAKGHIDMDKVFATKGYSGSQEMCTRLRAHEIAQIMTSRFNGQFLRAFPSYSVGVLAKGLDNELRKTGHLSRDATLGKLRQTLRDYAHVHDNQALVDLERNFIPLLCKSYTRPKARGPEQRPWEHSPTRKRHGSRSNRGRRPSQEVSHSTSLADLVTATLPAVADHYANAFSRTYLSHNRAEVATELAALINRCDITGKDSGQFERKVRTVLERHGRVQDYRMIERLAYSLAHTSRGVVEGNAQGLMHVLKAEFTPQLVATYNAYDRKKLATSLNRAFTTAGPVSRDELQYAVRASVRNHGELKSGSEAERLSRELVTLYNLYQGRAPQQAKRKATPSTPSPRHGHTRLLPSYGPLTKDIALRLEESYGFKIQTVKPLDGGFSTHRVLKLETDQGDFSLKQYSGTFNGQVPTQVGLGVTALEHLKKKESKIAALPRNIQNRCVLGTQAVLGYTSLLGIDKKMYSVHAFLEGRQPTNSKDDVRDIATAVAEYHKEIADAPVSQARPLDFKSTWFNPPVQQALAHYNRMNGSSSSNEQRVKNLLEPLERRVDTAARRLARIQDPSVVLCHRDIWYGNLIKKKEGSVALLDFDGASPDFRAYEVAWALHSIVLEEGGASQVEMGKISAFMLAYQRANKLSKAELAVIPDIMRSFTGHMLLRDIIRPAARGKSINSAEASQKIAKIECYQSNMDANYARIKAVIQGVYDVIEATSSVSVGYASPGAPRNGNGVSRNGNGAENRAGYNGDGVNGNKGGVVTRPDNLYVHRDAVGTTN